MLSPTPPIALAAGAALEPSVAGEPIRFEVPSQRRLTGLADALKEQLSGFLLQCPNTGYPDGGGTKPSFVAANISHTIVSPVVAIFNVTFRVRAVVERCGYHVGTGVFNPDGYTVSNGLNVTGGQSLFILHGSDVYFFNHKTGAEVINPIEAEDFISGVTFQVGTGDVITFGLGCTALRQRDNTIEHVVLTGFPPAPAVYPGQFAQFDCSSVVLVSVPPP